MSDTLFPELDLPPFVKGSDTSRKAAESMVGSAASLRARILSMIAASHPAGATCDEIEDRTALRHQTVSARIRELSQMGRIEDTGRRRMTRSGREARVYRATPA